MATTYYHPNYWHPNYWHVDYWTESESVGSGYWYEDYWHVGYWADGYWKVASGGPITGSPALDAITASGSITQTYKVSGTPTAPTITASSSVTQTYKLSGSPSVPTLTASGAITQTYRVSGTPSIEAVTAAGAMLGTPLFASGTPTVSEVTSSGIVNNFGGSAGLPRLDIITASGVSTLAAGKGFGTTTLDALTASGTVTQTYKASGTPTVPTITALGVTTEFANEALGTPSTPTLTASGAAAQTLKPSGTPTLDEFTASGVTIARGPRIASGTVLIDRVTSSGVAVGSGTITGTPSLDTLTASGTVKQILKPSGSVVLDVLTASGIAVIPDKTGSGTPILEVVSAVGVGNSTGLRTATGTPSIAEILADSAAVSSLAILTTTITNEVSVARNQNSITITLTNDTFNPMTNTIAQAIIDNLTSAQSEKKGWNNRVRDKLNTPAVVRMSANAIRIDINGFSGYSISANESITATIPAIALGGGIQKIAIPAFTITSVAASGTPVVNTTADDSVTSNYLIDDRTGFKEYVADGLSKDGHTGMMVRKKSRDQRHPMESLRSRGESQRGSVSPEQDDTFLTTNEVTLDDL